MVGVSFLAGVGFNPHHQMQISPGTQPSFCSMNNGDYILGAKAIGA
jgi:hypothetical protein